MDLQTWRESRKPQELTLPSGLTVRVKKVSVMDLAALGQIPAPLLAALGDNSKKDTESVGGGQKEDEAMWVVVKAAVIEPLIADEPDETHLGPDELPPGDRVVIFNWANAGAAPLEPFRQERKRDGRAARRGRDVPPAAQPPAGD